MAEDGGPVVDGDVPEPFLQGSFALYRLSDGSVVIAYRRKDGAETERIHVPAYVMTAAGKLSGGDPMSVLKGLGT